MLVNPRVAVKQPGGYPEFVNGGWVDKYHWAIMAEHDGGNHVVELSHEFDMESCDYIGCYETKELAQDAGYARLAEIIKELDNE